MDMDEIHIPDNDETFKFDKLIDDAIHNLIPNPIDKQNTTIFEE